MNRNHYPFRLLLFGILFFTFEWAYTQFVFAEIRNLHINCEQWPNNSDMRQFSLDAIRLMDAHSDEEKAKAIWRFIRMWSAYTTGTPPQEPVLGLHYVDDPLKVLNVYGAHWCDGLARIMETAWRSLGMRAEKLYRSGHTQVDLYWRDADGVTRAHLFDVSEGWFVYDRSGTHIASPDEIAIDYSLIYFPSKTPIPAHPHYWGMYNWIHAPHIEMPKYSPLLHLRAGETVTLYWGNLSLPYLNNFKSNGQLDFEHGPCPVTYGNGIIHWVPELEAYPDLIFKVKSPYIISHAIVSARFSELASGIPAAMFISVDSGMTWSLLWETEDAKDFDLRGFEIVNGGFSPFGRYEYFLKIQFQSDQKKTDSVNGHNEALNENDFLESIEIKTITQHNIFALPQLLPGKNKISVNGDIPNDAALQLTWRWEDLLGKNREHVSLIAGAPYQFDIVVAGEHWNDAKMNYLEIKSVSGHGWTSGEVVVEEKPERVNGLKQSEMFETETIIGTVAAPVLKSVANYIDDLNSHQNVRDALAGIMVLKDDTAWESVLNLAIHSIEHPIKEMAIQALFLMDKQRAIPQLQRFLKKESEIEWKYDAGNKFVELQHWYHICALIGRLFAINKEQGSVDLLMKVLDSMIVNDDNGWQTHASIIKSLGMMKAAEACNSIRPFLDGNPDEAAVAVWALGELDDQSSIEPIRGLLNNSSYEMIQLNSAVALCKLGDTKSLDIILPMLEREDENFRGNVADALGYTGKIELISHLEKLIKNETFPWVVALAQSSIDRLSRSCVAIKDDFTLTFPCVEFQGEKYSFQLYYDDNVFLWKLNWNTVNNVVDNANTECFIMDDAGKCSVSCAMMNYEKYEFDMALFQESEYADLKWYIY